MIAIYYLHVSQENKIQTIAASRDTRVFNFVFPMLLKKKGTSYQSVTFQGTMFNKSYQLYGLINTRSLVTQCIRPIYNLRFTVTLP